MPTDGGGLATGTTASGTPWPLIAAAVVTGCFLLPYFRASAVGRTSSNMPFEHMSGELGASMVWGWHLWWGWLGLLLGAATLGAGVLRRRRPELDALAAKAEAAGFAALTALLLLGLLLGLAGIGVSMYVEDLGRRVPVTNLSAEMNRVAQQQPGAGFVQMLGGRMQHEADVTVIPLGIIVLLAATGFGLFRTAPTLLHAVRSVPSASAARPSQETRASGRVALPALPAKLNPKVVGAAVAGVLGLIVVIGGLAWSGGPSGPDWLEGTFHGPSGNTIVIDVGGRKMRVRDPDEGSQTIKILSVSYPRPGVAEIELQRGSETRRTRFTRTANGVRTERLTPSGSWRHETTFHR